MGASAQTPEKIPKVADLCFLDPPKGLEAVCNQYPYAIPSFRDIPPAPGIRCQGPQVEAFSRL